MVKFLEKKSVLNTLTKNKTLTHFLYSHLINSAKETYV